MFKKINPIIVFTLAIACLALLSGCSNKEVVSSCLSGHTYGFLGGLFHGFIAPFDLIAMLFRNDITVFAQNNNGAWYAFGFLIGSGGWGFLGGKGASKNR
ncbi:MAG: hypothetical protein WCR72_04485 [Bacteroidota bacterium]